MTGSAPLDAALICLGLVVAGFVIGLGLGIGFVVAEWLLFGPRTGSEGL